jgi:hypothetical protein
MRNFAVIGESMTVSWRTGFLGLKHLDKYKRDAIPYEEQNSDYDNPSTLKTITSLECK